MPAGNLLLIGPIFWFVVIVIFGAGMLGAFVVIDSILRLRRGRYVAREPWWVYTVPQAAFLAVLLGVQLPIVPNWGGALVFLLLPFALAEQFAYLLRVVFPKPPAGQSASADDEAPANADEAVADTDEPTTAHES